LLKIGLTGGIAAGKSSVGQMFVALGARLIQADAIAHQLMQPGEEVYQEIVQRFGQAMLDQDGKINRARLADAVFGSRTESARGPHPPRIEELNHIVHPPVIRRHDEWMEQMGRDDPHSIAIVEAALILEAGLVKHFDRIVVVTCRPEQRIERWAHRTHVDLDSASQEVARRMAAQLPDAEKIKVADYVIDNSGSLEATSQQVKSVYREFETEA
jgi:dephospho-CoA kinase